MRLAVVSRIWFRPRILVDVTKVDWSTKILGYKSSMPVYIVSIPPRIWCEQKQTIPQTATALGKLGHPDGELNLTRAAAKHGVIQMVMNSMSQRLTISHTSIDTYIGVLLLRRIGGRCRTRPSTIFAVVKTFPPLCGSFLNSVYLRYVNKDRSITKRLVQHAEKRGIRGLFITVDAPQLGRREKVRCSILTSLLDIHRLSGHADEIRS
jgi:L-lactate dehydrogenase (cytochrome)